MTCSGETHKGHAVRCRCPQLSSKSPLQTRSATMTTESALALRADPFDVRSNRLNMEPFHSRSVMRTAKHGPRGRARTSSTLWDPGAASCRASDENHDV